MELSNLLWRIAHGAPWLIVYLIAGIMGLVFLNKCKTPALLALLGSLLAGVTTVVTLIVSELMWAGARENGDIKATADITRIISVGANLLEAIGMGMIVFAVFAGRKQVRRDDEDDDRPRRNRRDDRDDRDDPPTARPSRPRS